MADTPTQAEVDTLFKNLEDSSRRYNSANFRQDGKALAYFGVAVEKHRAALKEACTAMIERIAELEVDSAQLESDVESVMDRATDFGLIAIKYNERMIERDKRIAELEACATCDHGEDAAVEWLPAFENAEIYRCGCGALLNINDPMRAMTAEEICVAVREESRSKENTDE